MHSKRQAMSDKENDDIEMFLAGHEPFEKSPSLHSNDKISAATDVHALGMLANACFNSHPPRVWAEIIRRSTSSASEQRYTTVAAFARAIRWRHWRSRIIIVASFALLAVAAVLWITVLRTSAGSEPSAVAPSASDSHQAPLTKEDFIKALRETTESVGTFYAAVKAKPE